MPTKPYYVALVTEAEQAVADVKDPELRRAAFEKILETLLGGPGPLLIQGETKKLQQTRARGKALQSKTRGGPQAYIEELVGDGFFKQPRTMAQVKTELSNRGHHIVRTSLSGPLQKLCQRKLLRRQKVKGKGAKQSFNYSNW